MATLPVRGKNLPPIFCLARLCESYGGGTGGRFSFRLWAEVTSVWKSKAGSVGQERGGRVAFSLTATQILRSSNKREMTHTSTLTHQNNHSNVVAGRVFSVLYEGGKKWICTRKKQIMWCDFQQKTPTLRSYRLWKLVTLVIMDISGLEEHFGPLSWLGGPGTAEG